MPYLIICGLVITGLSQLSTNKNFTGALAMATTVKPETFTELYFEDHSNLPSTASASGTINFSFTVHNLENKKFDYPYEVYLEWDHSKTIIDKNHLTLNPDEYKTTKISYTPVKEITTAKVVINLISKEQQIYFWLKGRDE